MARSERDLFAHFLRQVADHERGSLPKDPNAADVAHRRARRMVVRLVSGKADVDELWRFLESAMCSGDATHRAAAYTVVGALHAHYVNG